MCVGLTILCFNTLLEDGTLVPKYVGIGTWYEVSFMMLIYFN